MDGEVVLSPVVHPPKSTAAAYNVYPFSGGGGRHHRRHHRRHRLPLPLTTFTILRCPKLSPGTPELRAGTRRVYARVRGSWNTVSYDPGWAGGARREDGRKFATSSLMLLKQKTPASTEPVRVASRATPLSRRGVGPSFLPSFRPSYPVYFPCCPSSTFVKRRTSLNPALSPPVLILLVAPSYRASP